MSIENSNRYSLANSMRFLHKAGLWVMQERFQTQPKRSGKVGAVNRTPWITNESHKDESQHLLIKLTRFMAPRLWRITLHLISCKFPMLLPQKERKKTL